jgi:hypothetical protein
LTSSSEDSAVHSYSRTINRDQKLNITLSTRAPIIKQKKEMARKRPSARPRRRSPLSEKFPNVIVQCTVHRAFALESCLFASSASL